MEYTFTSVHTQKDKRAQHVSQTVLVRDSQPVGAAAGGSSHQRSESSLAPKSDWLETRRKEKPLARGARDETAKSPSHQRNLSGAGTPGRGGIFNRVTQLWKPPPSVPLGALEGLRWPNRTPISLLTEEKSIAVQLSKESRNALSPLCRGTPGRRCGYQRPGWYDNPCHIKRQQFGRRNNEEMVAKKVRTLQMQMHQH